MSTLTPPVTLEDPSNQSRVDYVLEVSSSPDFDYPSVSHKAFRLFTLRQPHTFPRDGITGSDLTFARVQTCAMLIGLPRDRHLAEAYQEERARNISPRFELAHLLGDRSPRFFKFCTHACKCIQRLHLLFLRARHPALRFGL